MLDPKPNPATPPSFAAPLRAGFAPSGPQVTLVRYGAIGAVVVAGVSYALVGASWGGMALALGGYAVGVALAMGLMSRGFARPTLGACNVVTLLRLMLVAALLSPLVQPGADPWLIFAISGLALCLDGVDGWLARRMDHATPFGARFDMEVDAALAMILALNLWAAGTVGFWVLALGLPRYAFAAAMPLLPWLDQPLPPRFSRKLVCVVQIGVLVALLPQALPPAVASGLVAVAVLALAWSFARDILWLRRQVA